MFDCGAHPCSSQVCKDNESGLPEVRGQLLSLNQDYSRLGSMLRPPISENAQIFSTKSFSPGRVVRMQDGIGETALLT